MLCCHVTVLSLLCSFVCGCVRPCVRHLLLPPRATPNDNFLFFRQSCIITCRRCKVVKCEMNWCWNCTALQLCLETPRTSKRLLSGIYITNMAAVCSFRIYHAKYRTVTASGATIDRGCFTHYAGVKNFQTERCKHLVICQRGLMKGLVCSLIKIVRVAWNVTYCRH